jgi:hypothetical protein
MGKRELLLIVGFIVAGAIVYTFTAPPPGPNERSLSLSRLIDNIRREVRGNPGKAELTTTSTYPVDAETEEVVVRSAFSQVEVVGQERSDIEVSLRVTSNGTDDADAKRLAERTTVKIDRPGRAMSFAPDAPPEGTQRLYLTMHVPNRLSVRIETPSSRVSVSNVPALEVTSGRTETIVKGVSGRATIAQRGGRLVIEDVESLKLNARGSETTLRNISGEAALTLVSGEMKAEGLAGPLDLDTQSAEVRLDRAERSKGALRINAVGGEVVLNGVKSDTRIDSRNSGIAVTLSEPAPVVIYSTGDEPVDLTLPSGGFVLDAVATDGRITEDVIRRLGLTLTAAEGAREQRATGSVKGGGPAITVRSNGGDIRLNAR